MKIAVIITAGGIGKRMGLDKPKQHLELLGKPIICHTLDRFIENPKISKIIITVPSEYLVSFRDDILAPFGYDNNLEIIAGGNLRQDSIKNALDVVPDNYDIVLVHDACRPFIDQSLIDKLIDGATEFGAAIPASPLKETIKRVSEDGLISETVDRNNLWGAQTPQTFRVRLLKDAFKKAYKDNFYGTDDASLVERIGVNVKLIEGDSRNIKITTSSDLILAEAILKSCTE